MESLSQIQIVKLQIKITLKNVFIPPNWPNMLTQTFKLCSFNLIMTLGKLPKFWVWIVLKISDHCRNVQLNTDKLFKIITKRLKILWTSWLNFQMLALLELHVLHISLQMANGTTLTFQFQWVQITQLKLWYKNGWVQNHQQNHSNTWTVLLGLIINLAQDNWKR